MPDGALATRRLAALAIGVNWFESGSGGLDRVFYDLLHALPDAGVDMRGLVVGPRETGARTGGRVTCFGTGGGSLPRRLLDSRRGMAATLRSEKFDMVASHFAMFTLPSLDLIRNLPLAVHFHGPWADESAAEGSGRFGVALKRAVEGQVYRRAERLIVLSQAFADLAVECYHISEQRLRIVPGSVDLHRFNTVPGRAEARAALGWPTDRPILLAVRRLSRRMGLDGLIEAMKLVAHAVPEVKLLIAGTGRHEASLRAQVAAGGLEPHVEFLGFLPDADLPLAYRAADANLVPSLALEGFGLTAAEALAAGTPSIVSPIGGLPEVVAPLSANLVFASVSPAAIAEHLVAVLRGRVVLPPAEACRDYAVARFDVNRAATQVAAIYRELV